jgi:DNA-binding beta-propeller fold protein YncE
MCDTLFAVRIYSLSEAGFMSRCLSLLILVLGLSSHLVHAESYKVTGSIPIGGTGHWDYLLADSENRRLYVLHNAEVVVIDLDSQKILGKISVGGFSHGIAIVPEVNLGFITTGGSGTVVRQEGKDQYSVLDTVQTEPGARTLAMDLKTHTIYLSSAKFGPKPEGSRFPSVVPQTFKVLVLKQP